MYLKTKTTKCPECGAAILISNTDEITRCSHCNSPILVRLNNYITPYFIKSLVNVKDTTTILLSRLKHFLIANDFIPKSKVMNRTLYYVPFIYITGFRCSEHLLEEKDRLTNSLVGDTRIIRTSFKYLAPAVKLSDWGTIKVDADRIFQNKNTLRPLREFTSENGVFIQPDVFTTPTDDLNLRFMTPNENIKTEIIVENSILIYYPIIRVVLKYRRNIYHYSIDGLTGEILYGTAPESENNRFLPMAVAAFFTALFASGIGRFLLNTHGGGVIFMSFYFLPVFIGFVIELLVFIYIAWIFYRNYGEIVIEREKVEINKLNIPEETYLEKILRPIFKVIEEIIKFYRKKTYRRFPF
ncbi:MAG: hypothetical protein N2746_06565 [Deltaproteobacteria bacterium]|nr:hypothetical protein [Deltaproteobacteria bacterium]